MKKILIVLLIALVVGTASVSFAGVASTKHNLSTSNTLFATHTTNATATVCGFCHIPHGGSTAVTGLPLWARKNNTNAYTLYGGGKTLANTTINQPGAFSLTCLSCHDGTIGVGTITKNGIDTTFAMTGNVVVATGVLDPTKFAATSYEPMLSTDLRNDHPVGFQFPGGAGYGASGGIPGISITVRNSGAANANLTGSVTLATFPLFQPNGTDRFECATCHDPHAQDNITYGAGATKFLRAKNANVCQECHDVK